MASCSVVIATCILLIPMSVNATKLPQQPFEFKTPQSGIPRSILNSYEDSSSKLPTTVTTDFYPDHKSDLENGKIVNTIVKLKTIPEQDKIYNKKHAHGIKKPSDMLKKITRPKTNPTKSAKQFIPETENVLEIFQSRAIALEWPHTSNDSPFETWSKYLTPVLQFPELYMKQNAHHLDSQMSNNQRSNDKRTKLDFSESEFQSGSEAVQVESQNENLKSSHELSAKLAFPLPSLKNKDGQIFIADSSQLNPTTNHPQVSYVGTQTSNLKDPTPRKKVLLQIFPEDKLKHRSFHQETAESERLPWELHKMTEFAPIMPFPELHETRFRPKLDDSTSQKRLPLTNEQRTPDVAGPILHPQSNFEKEIRVPFF